MTECSAPDLLSQFLADRKGQGLTQVEAARQLAIPPSALTGYIKRKQRPRSDIRQRIAKWTSGEVPESAWLTADELSELGSVGEVVIPTGANEPPDPEDGAESDQSTGTDE